MPEMKRSIKDSVFTLMFQEPKYALQLYQSLHPEDKDVTEADCQIVDENRRKYGRGAEAAEEILRQCREEGILVPFLASREKEAPGYSQME